VEKFDTPVVGLVIRTLANAEDEADLDAAHKLQDIIKISAGSDTPFAMPDKDAVYVNVQPNLPVGEYELTVKDVTVKGFCRSASITPRAISRRMPSRPTASTTDREAERRRVLHHPLRRMRRRRRELPAHHGRLELCRPHV